MHKLGRHVRFSTNPFLAKDSPGSNPFASEPAGEGLSLFFELCVELSGEVAPETGFVVNVTEIDRGVRARVAPLFAECIRQEHRAGRHIGFVALGRLLKSAWDRLASVFGPAGLSRLTLKLNPFRMIGIDSGDSQMLYFGEKFEFAATHKLWNDELSKERNLEIFGKCANLEGHGHNYVVEVTVRAPQGGDFRIGEFEKVVDRQLMRLVDHKNLNVDVAEFGKSMPTVENIALFAWNKLAGKFAESTLHCVTVWETDKTYSSYYGPDSD
jgi:6-pyruvoyltetrahydropterin/6-carboxytetrahydropterin synthase